NEMGLLATAARGDKIETYEYEIEPGILNGPFNLVKTTDSNGAETTCAYHGQGDAAISTVANVKAFKSQDAVKTVIYPDGATVHFAYDAAAENIRRVTDPRGNDATYTLNYTGNPLKIEEPGGKTLEFTWSIDAGEDDIVMTSKVDARGNATTYEYDQKGNITRETDPYGNAILTTWDLKYSVPLQRTDRNGVDQRWEYDEKGNLTLHADGEGGQTRYAYFPTGELQAETDPRDFTTTYTYDQWGALATVLGP
ncbi:MAG: RHS repeat protein, partial [Desulfobacterales bacterium]|nr:RHS repeat protein [Desulfobacterales bacterium]